MVIICHTDNVKRNARAGMSIENHTANHLELDELI